jgi:hypothetical protein
VEGLGTEKEDQASRLGDNLFQRDFAASIIVIVFAASFHQELSDNLVATSKMENKGTAPFERVSTEKINDFDDLDF